MAKDMENEKEDRQVKMSFGRETADVQAAARNVDPEGLMLLAEEFGLTEKSKDKTKKRS